MNDATMNDEHPLLTQLIDLLADILVTSSTQNDRLSHTAAEPRIMPSNEESSSDLDSKDNRGHHEQK